MRKWGVSGWLLVSCLGSGGCAEDASLVVREDAAFLEADVRAEDTDIGMATDSCSPLVAPACGARCCEEPAPRCAPVGGGVASCRAEGTLLPGMACGGLQVGTCVSGTLCIGDESAGMPSTCEPVCDPDAPESGCGEAARCVDLGQLFGAPAGACVARGTGMPR